MTGKEYLNLKIGNNVTVETPFSNFTKGQVLKVEYIDSTHQEVYLRDTSKPLGNQLMTTSILFILDYFRIGGELPKKNDRTVELPFALHDKVWFLYNNEVCNGEIINCNAQIYCDGISTTYKLLFTGRYGESAVTIVSNKLFNTKEELLRSL